MPEEKTTTTTPAPADNLTVADRLSEAADLLEQQAANPFRVNAYRRSANTLASLHESVSEIASSRGIEGLTDLHGVGRGIASAILEMVLHGRWNYLERLRGGLDPAQVFQSVPGIGPKLAEEINDSLDVDTLEALEVAVYDGRLEKVKGIGPSRAAMVRTALESMLGTVTGPGRHARRREPGVDQILDVDREYREKAAAGSLRTIAPHRFNPKKEAWLPVLHTERGPWVFTALFSNSARAHTLDRTRDWVLIYHYDNEHLEGQQTVVTERRGPLASKRVVRGREAECRVYYARQEATLSDRKGGNP